MTCTINIRLIGEAHGQGPHRQRPKGTKIRGGNEKGALDGCGVLLNSAVYSPRVKIEGTSIDVSASSVGTVRRIPF